MHLLAQSVLEWSFRNEESSKLHAFNRCEFGIVPKLQLEVLSSRNHHVSPIPLKGVLIQAIVGSETAKPRMGMYG